MIIGAINGIQGFLFDVRESGGGQAKSLRYRSFRIQLIAECVTLRLLEAAGLSHDEHLLFCAAGKICINAEHLSADSIVAVHRAVADVERRLITDTQGQLRLSVAVIRSSDGFADRFECANRALAKNKLRPFTLSTHDKSSTWKGGSLVVHQVWDAEAEAEHDAALGRDLVNASWLTIRRADVQPGKGELDMIGYRVRLDKHEPIGSDGIVSCSNLVAPDSSPRSIDCRFFHSRRLARHVPRDHNGNPLEFVEIAARSRGAPMLGILKADADSLGTAIADILGHANGKAAAALRELSRSLDDFFAETLEREKLNHLWSNIYTVFSGGDDMLAVGPWDTMLDFAAHARRLFHEQFGAGAPQATAWTPLTLSAGVAIIKPKYPVHLAAHQADELLEQAKTKLAPRADQPKDQCAGLGSVWKWHDHGTIIDAGKRLADWVDTGVIQRGWLNTLLQMAHLRRGKAGPEYADVHPAVATSRLEYHVSRNWPRRRSPPKYDSELAGNAAREWIEAVLREFDQFDSTTHSETIHLPAVVRYAMLATRSGGSEDGS